MSIRLSSPDSSDSRPPEFRYDLVRCYPEAVTDAFLEMAAAGYEAIDAQRRFSTLFYSGVHSIATRIAESYRESAENAFEHAWKRWKTEEIDTSDCEDGCAYGPGGCGGYPPQCGGCCNCIMGCVVQMENSWVADQMLRGLIGR